jgi:hypothetical protein
VAVNRRYGADVVLGIKPGAPSTAGRPASMPRLSPAMREYFEATALKPIYERLASSRSRTAEENFLLAEIMDRCALIPGRPRTPPRDASDERARFLATLSDKDPNRDKRVAAFEQMKASRCDGMESIAATEDEIRSLLSQGVSDPKAKARLAEKDVAASVPGNRYGQQADGSHRGLTITDAQLDALKQAAQSGDPMALTIAGRVLASTMDNLLIRTGDGQQPLDPRAFYEAWSLAACDAGLPCGAGSSRLLNACAMRGNCGAQDLREHLFYFDLSPQQSQRLAEYHGAVARATQTGDWSYFDFHRGQGPRGSMSIFISR